MSIRLRFTLLYNTILALTLAVFGIALYSIQAGVTYNALQQDLIHTSQTIGTAVLTSVIDPNLANLQLPSGPFNAPPPKPFNQFSGDPTFQRLPEREIVRVIDSSGNLVASPTGSSSDALPLSTAGLQSLQANYDAWETATVQGQSMLIYSHPITSNGKVVYAIQVARPLTERDRSLNALGITLIIASLVTILAAFGIGWVLSGITLQPIRHLTQTAQTIGDERDFTRRVNYTGPQDEVGQLATTFNSMLARLQDAYQQVAHSLDMQRSFVADVSHELRTPLTTLRGNLGLLRRDPPIPADEQTDILTDMTDESDRLIRLVNDLLILARADAGRNLVREPLAILPVLEEICRQARQLDPQRNISLAAEDLSIEGDRDALKQVLLIGLDNALKHSGGDIDVTAENQGAQIEIRVLDHGEGIAPDKLERIFDRFYRGEESVTIPLRSASGTMSPGFGLGLPIARALVEGMGGTIEMRSEVGQGSEMILRFPANLA